MKRSMDVALDVGPFLPILGMYGSRNLVDKVMVTFLSLLLIFFFF